MNKKWLFFLFLIILIVSGAIYFWRSGAFSYKTVSLSKEVAISEEAEAEKTIESENLEDNKENQIVPETAKQTNQSEAINKKEEKTSEDKTEVKNANVINRLVSWGYTASSNRKIKAIIIHSSYDAQGSDPYSVSGLIKEYKNYGVAPHYLIDRSGSVYLLVAEKNIAYHAGVAKLPDGETQVNEVSIGIEIMTTKDESPTSAQYLALKGLIKDIKGRYAIKYVLGHVDIAPGRKDDPWNFDWNKLK